jgi:hypothetical protein
MNATSLRCHQRVLFLENTQRDKMDSILIIDDPPHVRKLDSKVGMRVFLFAKHPELYSL